MSTAMMTNALATSAALFSSSKASHQLRAFGLPHLYARKQFRLSSSSKLVVRASQQQQQQKESVPLAGTKVDISEADVKKNEQEEVLKVFENTPAGKFARPESERRPELGNTEVLSVMRFDGPAPETINGRLAMLGITWAFVAEVLTGKSIVQQLLGGTGVIWFLATVPLFVWASLVPIFGWNESPDSRAFGPFNAKAERWNGRAAMIGFAAVLIVENLWIRGPLFGFLHH